MSLLQCPLFRANPIQRLPEEPFRGPGTQVRAMRREQLVNGAFRLS
jgi:hypothetical protein